ncbi:MAG: class I SAM-dependent methyltransferase [Rubrivivax sp.]|nr:class I SAM-dependent methyltransferase [Rubrivivax sp.]
MISVQQHYETHLAPVYLWMAGGLEHALALGAADVAPFVDRPGLAVDLGAGFGMHSLPLARAGFRVLAVDTSRHLLAELQQHAAGLQVQTVEADLVKFAAHLSGPADLVLCMGDTLTHLGSRAQVERLLHTVAGALAPGGRFVATFRDYRHLPEGDARFIAVRSGALRIHTCFLEEQGDRVQVHDVLHERPSEDAPWQMRVSSYLKLRLAPEWLIAQAQSSGLRCQVGPGPLGMLQLVAQP